ncbi:MAG: hypothetical protein J5449_08655 [Oscillospiraceae bacterium]|nr:hypothetical protein [Oscillospiraceae bacterium]
MHSETGIKASIYCEADISAKAICAVYDVCGQMLSVDIKPLVAGTENTVAFSVKLTGAKTVKVFVVGQDVVPYCTYKELEL